MNKHIRIWLTQAKTIWVIGLIWGLLPQVEAQQQITKNFSIAEGLPNNAIRSLFLDSREMLWIGTENGVSVKQNNEFLSFFMEDGLAFNSCWDITEDHHGQVWFGSYGGGVSMFDGNTFHQIKEGLYTPFIRSMHVFGDHVWVGTTNGLNLIHTKTLEVIRVSDSQGDEALNFISGFFEYENRFFYTTYRNGVYEVVPSSAGAYRAELINSLEYIYSIHHDDSLLYIAGREQISQYPLTSFLSTNPTPNYTQSSTNFYKFHQTENFGLLAAGMGLYSPNGGVFGIGSENLNPLNQPLNIKSSNLWSMAYNPRSDILYVGSLDKGLYEINLSKRLLLFESNNHEILGFAGIDTLDVILQSNGLFIQANKMLVSKNEFKRAQARYFKNARSWIPSIEDDFYELNEQLTSREIIFYGLKVNQESYWINSNIGLYEVSKKGSIVRYLPLHTFVFGFTPEGYLIESNPFGGMRIYPDLNSPDRYTHYSTSDPNTPNMLSQIIGKEDRTYFASVFAGLFRLDKNGLFSLKENGVWDVEKIKSIYATTANQLIVGAEFGDIFVIEDGKEFKELLHIPKSKIYGNSIVGVKTYADALFILTEKGVNVYQNGVVKLIDEEQGLRKTLIKSFKIIHETLYLGYEDAYVSIHLPSLLKDTYQSYELKVTKLLVNYEKIKSVENRWFNYHPGNISLKNPPVSISIQVQPHTLLYPEKLQYRYRITSEQEWTPFSRSNEIFLTNLNHGNYSIEIEVFDLHSGKSEYFSLFTIRIMPPIYLEAWFILLVILLLSLLILGIFQIRVAQIREAEAIQRKIAETKIEALRSQMNPHFIFNAINSIQYFILKNDTEKAMDFLSKFSLLIRKTLDNTKNNQIRLSSEIDYLRSYMSVENERMGNRIQWEVSLDESLDPEFIDIPPMLIQPFIENAFVHAFPPAIEQPIIRVSFEKVSMGNITCIIWDNGIGIAPKSQKSHRSRGLELVSERIGLLPKALPEAISIVSKEQFGTEIRVKIPVNTHGPMEKIG
ncbi:histidine kinase [Mongoliitalea daihaiensis]|uniref:histidine kinase n=1 Tax=Mongoliitalea daihaiensis TaxID=2782006 RepID=UPI001F2DFFEF|nr:histidine kinase [Mongoliitalea daihaiensis]UJP66011.1 histidine kinase [Mongoliitalea daihaiensis]